MKVRSTVKENPDSQFTAMPESITPVGMELNPQTEPIEQPTSIIQTNSEIDELITEPSEENKN